MINRLLHYYYDVLLFNYCSYNQALSFCLRDIITVVSLLNRTLMWHSLLSSPYIFTRLNVKKVLSAFARKRNIIPNLIWWHCVKFINIKYRVYLQHLSAIFCVMSGEQLYNYCRYTLFINTSYIYWLARFFISHSLNNTMCQITRCEKFW